MMLSSVARGAVVLADVRAVSKVNAQYIITGNNSGESIKTMLKRIDSQEELDAYCEEYREFYCL